MISLLTLISMVVAIATFLIAAVCINTNFDKIRFALSNKPDTVINRKIFKLISGCTGHSTNWRLINPNCPNIEVDANLNFGEVQSIYIENIKDGTSITLTSKNNRDFHLLSQEMYRTLNDLNKIRLMEEKRFEVERATERASDVLNSCLKVK